MYLFHVTIRKVTKKKLYLQSFPPHSLFSPRNSLKAYTISDIYIFFRINVHHYKNSYYICIRIRDVAQPGRVHVWGACCRRFKSCHPDRKRFSKLKNNLLNRFPILQPGQERDKIILHIFLCILTTDAREQKKMTNNEKTRIDEIVSSPPTTLHGVRPEELGFPPL